MLELLIKRSLKYGIRGAIWILSKLLDTETAKQEVASVLNRRLEEIVPPDDDLDDAEEAQKDLAKKLIWQYQQLDVNRISDIVEEIRRTEHEIMVKEGDLEVSNHFKFASEAGDLRYSLDQLRVRLAKYRELLANSARKETEPDTDEEEDPLPWLEKIKATRSFEELGAVLVEIPPKLLYQCVRVLRQKQVELTGGEMEGGLSKEEFSKQLEQLLKNITDPTKV